MFVTVLALVYLVLMFINLVIPTGLASPRGSLFNLDWVTLMIIALLGVIGVVVFYLAPGNHKKK